MNDRLFRNRMRGRLFKNKEGKRRRGVHLIPNILTTGNLFSGLAAVVLVYHGRFEAAAIAIGFLLVDMFFLVAISNILNASLSVFSDIETEFATLVTNSFGL